MRITDGSCEILQQIAETLRRARRVVVLIGAGVSTSCGIPDFRSPHGIHTQTVSDLLEKLHSDLLNREDDDGETRFQRFENGPLQGIDKTVLQARGLSLFESDCFRSDKSKLASYRALALLKEYIIQKVHTPTKMHQLIGDLRTGGRLLHCYTQNIDGLEALAGCSIYTGQEEEFDVIQLHGGLHVAFCQGAGHWSPWNGDLNKSFLANDDVVCGQCQRKSRAGRNWHRAKLRPGIVFFGEEVPHHQIIADTLHQDMKRKPDLFLIVGTSLKIPGASGLVKDMVQHMKGPRRGREVIMVGNTRPARELEKFIDVFVQMDIESFAMKVSSPELQIHREHRDVPKPRGQDEELLDWVEFLVE